jgi:hypothetical protein
VQKRYGSVCPSVAQKLHLYLEDSPQWAIRLHLGQAVDVDVERMFGLGGLGYELSMIQDMQADPMMARLITSLAEHEDIGHYGRLVFAMVGRYFASDDELVAALQNDRDFSEEQARELVREVHAVNYSPPKREKIIEFQSRQAYRMIENVQDPDVGNVYRTLQFPEEMYHHIAEYREQKAHASS